MMDPSIFNLLTYIVQAHKIYDAFYFVFDSRGELGKYEYGRSQCAKYYLLTYHHDAEQKMIQFRLLPQAVIPQPVSFQQSRPGSMGVFDALPFEIIYNILDHLDFRSLEKMMSINPHCKATVESLPAYRDMITHVSGTVEALMSSGVVEYFTAGQLHATLRTDRYEGCGDFGAFLFLLTCSRRCLLCICRDPQLRGMAFPGAMACFGLTMREVRQLPILVSTPEIYTRRYQVAGRRLRLVSVEAARSLGIAKFEGEDNMRAFVDAAYSAKCLTFDQQMAARSAAGAHQARKPRRPRSLALNTVTDWGLASTPFPSLNVRSQILQWGISCQGCRDDYLNHRMNQTPAFLDDEESRKGLMNRLERYFSNEEFLAHVKECETGQSLWRSHSQASCPGNAVGA